MDKVQEIQRRTSTWRKYKSNHQTCLALFFPKLGIRAYGSVECPDSWQAGRVYMNDLWYYTKAG
jgi:hypothetical protein